MKQKQELFEEIIVEEKKEIDFIRCKIEKICNKHKIKQNKILEIIDSGFFSYLIPVEIFSCGLSPLETIVQYLKDEESLNFSVIAKLLNRDERTIWTTYRNSGLKKKLFIKFKSSTNWIPINLFSDRRLSILEIVCMHLKKKGFGLTGISRLLEKDTSTIWTTLNRAKMKVGK